MQFGGMLDRTLTLTQHADPRHGPPSLGKHDVDNGFYQMQLEPKACLALAILPPRYADKLELIAIPMSTTMGWVQSPATFCTMSETVCDLANSRFQAKLPAPDHRLETLCYAQDDLSPSWLPCDREEEDHTANLALAAVPGVIDWDPQTSTQTNRRHCPTAPTKAHSVTPTSLWTISSRSGKEEPSACAHSATTCWQPLTMSWPSPSWATTGTKPCPSRNFSKAMAAGPLVRSYWVGSSTRSDKLSSSRPTASSNWPRSSQTWPTPAESPTRSSNESLKNSGLSQPP